MRRHDTHVLWLWYTWTTFYTLVLFIAINSNTLNREQSSFGLPFRHWYLCVIHNRKSPVIHFANSLGAANYSLLFARTLILWPDKVTISAHGPLARYVKLRFAHAPGMPGTLSPLPRVSDPDMHHGTCVTHVPWCMSGSLTGDFLWNRWRGRTFPAFPAHAQPTILRICQKAHATAAELTWHATMCNQLWPTGGTLNMNMSYHYRDPHVKDKTVWRPSYL